MYGYHDYVSVDKKRAKAQKELEKRRKRDPNIAPVIIEGKKIAKTWWGVAWTKNLESYADYDNRVQRGRAYVKNGMVIDLRIYEGTVTAVVMGSSSPYQVEVMIDPLSENKWEELSAQCGQKIDSLNALVEGRFPKELEKIFENSELFPTPKQITFDCTCFDYASMCKHVAAVLYAIGARFDEDPTLFFKLRGVNFSSLLKKSIDEKMQTMLENAQKKSERVIKDTDIETLFGL